MLRDVFYYGTKPNAHPREQFAKNLDDARQKCTTEHFWIINELCDYRGFDWDFDFDFLPDEDVWAEAHNNVWPSQHQKDSGTWLCPKEYSEYTVYRGDVEPVQRTNTKSSNWIELDLVDSSKFDFSWHPDPADPPFIYKWGSKFFPAQLKHVLEYHVPGAVQEKYMNITVELLPETERWIEYQAIDKTYFDMSWRPDPMDPPFIYVWGNKYIDGKLKPTVEYHVSGATNKKYMPDLLKVLPEWDKWVEVQPIDKTTFDFSWRPDPREPDLIYVFGNELFDAVKMPTVEYRMDGAIDRKYVEDSTAKLLPNPKLFEHLEDAVLPNYSWLPDPDSPPYIYVWGNQWNEAADKTSVQFVVPGATEYKYMAERAIKKPCMDNWIIPEGVDCTGFDFSWEPSPAAPPYNYEFGTQWQKTGGPIYAVGGATEKTYVDFQKVKRTVIDSNWHIPDNIDPKEFDFTWHPDATDPAYDYVFATQWAFSGGPVYKMEGATGIKYVEDQIAKATTSMDNWAFDADLIDVDNFDWSWHPYVEDVPYIYEFGTQHQKTGGPKYITPGADSSSPVKYIDTRILKSTRLPNKDAKWHVVNDYRINNFDYSWHPDATEEPYIYVFGNTQYPAEEMPTIEYRMAGATTIKYVPEILATLEADLRNWQIPECIDTEDFDFSWHPNPNDPPYIYEFGTQWQKTGGPRYTVSGAVETKYIETQKVKKTSVDDCWHIPDNIDPKGFDFTWHPDATAPAYDYIFATQWAFSGGPIYKMENTTGIKYVEDQTAKAIASMENWVFDPDLIEIESFDWSWHPYVEDQPYVYEFGTQWQKTGGPKYITPGADSSSPIKYIDTRILKATRLPNKDARWHVINDCRIKSFDYSWHPDNTEESFIYVFGNNQYPAEEMSTIEYRVPGATKTKYVSSVVAVLEADLRNWQIPEYIDTEGFDFSWHPNPNDPPYIYEFGTQWQKTGGPVYLVKGATETKYVDTQVVTKTSVDGNWEVPSYIDNDSFDFTWHPDATSPAYNYVFPTQWAFSGGPVYRVEGATEIKYVEEQTAKALPNKENWEFDPKIIDESSIDFSWHPYADDQPYIYEFGTQWQPNGGPRYITSGATENSPVKYVDRRIMQTTRFPSTAYWNTLTDHPIESFDYSWHPDNTEEPYVHVFGNTQYPAEEMPTLEYRVLGADTIKYEHDVIAKLGHSTANWEVSKHLDVSNFDFSWIPHPDDPAFIYEFGTQWQKTGGPRYIVPNATQVKYVDTRIQSARRLPNRKNWNVLVEQAIDDFDYSWHPDDTEEPYIYVFGNTQYPAEEMPTIEYRVANATSIKYVHDTVAKLAPSVENWEISDDLDVSQFDFSWVPHPDDPPFIYQFGTQWQKTGGPKYITPDAVHIKYVDTRIQTAIRTKVRDENWIIPENIDAASIDYSWHPDATEQPYIYQFGTQHQKTGGPKYVVPGATEVKYVEGVIGKRLPNSSNWIVPDNLNVAKFDFSWHPDESAPPYIYQFGTQWALTDGPRYTVPGATEISYVEGMTAIVGPSKKNWEIPDDVDALSFDFSWHPYAADDPFIYQFGTQWQKTGGPRYVVSGATQLKYVDTRVLKADKLPAMNNWYVPENTDVSTFDFSWHPDDTAGPVIYEFATVWNDRGGPRYIVPGATEYKYIEDIKAVLKPNRANWEIPEGVDVSNFDFSWVPHPNAPPYLYQFGTQLDNADGPRYVTPNNTGEIVYLERVNIAEPEEIVVGQYYIETTLEDLVNEHPNEVFWALRKNINYDTFDFTWEPASLRDLEYVQVFGSVDSELTQTYYVSAKNYLRGNKNFKFVEDLTLDDIVLPNIFVKPDMFFVDRSNPESAARFEALKAKYGTRIQKTRYLNSWVDTINRCINRSTTELLWVLNSELDYTDFNFEYYPNPWQMKMVQVFGTQWSHWGTTFMVNRETFAEDTKYIKIIEHLSNLNFIKDIKATATQCVHDIVVIDHGNKELTRIVDQLKKKAPNKNVTTVKYNQTYFDTLKDIISKQQEKKEHYIWICSSVCDYEDFDLSYVCDPFARDQLHVFPSGRQKFGDTFFIDVNKTREIISEMQVLDDYHKVNYNGTLKATRLPEPTIVISDDTHVNAVKLVDSFPYATLITSDNVNLDAIDIEPMSLWTPETKNIIVTSTGATRIVVPKEAMDHVKNELYDYPYIKRAPKLMLSSPLDIVFLSNGEAGAEENWEHLLSATKGIKNRIVRVDGVNGRVAAYHAAAEASNTPWMFTVFAKLKISPKFDWNWQPDRMQAPKHYIFHAKNLVNGLTYGHQAMIAYNKKLTLANEGRGLDFTLDNLHETVPLVSGTAQYNTDEFSTWRTAFREVLKLRADDTDIAKERLNAWLNKAEGNFAQYSIKGAVDADEYYDEVNGDFDALKLSYEWAWLKQRFDEL